MGQRAARHCRRVPDCTNGRIATIILGIICLIVGFVLSIHILWTIGIILLVIGAIMWLLGSVSGDRYRFAADDTGSDHCLCFRGLDDGHRLAVSAPFALRRQPPHC